MNAKHVICFGDSNTHGYCGDPAEFDGLPQPSGSMRYSESSRWPRLLQDKLGEDYLILDEGLNGRTTVFEDPYRQGLTGAGYIWPCLMSHKPVDLLILMLGTNDAKEWYGATALQICAGWNTLSAAHRTPPAGRKRGRTSWSSRLRPSARAMSRRKASRNSDHMRAKRRSSSQSSMNRAQNAWAALFWTRPRWRSSTPWTAYI